MTEREKKLLAALQVAELWMPDPHESDGARFERLGEAFRKDTGHLRPGKDYPPGEPRPEDLHGHWRRWVLNTQARAAGMVRDAIAEATAKEMRIWFNGHDHVIAADGEAAQAVLAETTGCDAEPAEGDGWKLVPPERVISIASDEGGMERKTAAEWLAASEPNTPGVLCSEDW